MAPTLNFACAPDGSSLGGWLGSGRFPSRWWVERACSSRVAQVHFIALTEWAADTICNRPNRLTKITHYPP